MFLRRRIVSRKRAELRLEEIEELLEQGHFSRAYKEAEKAREDGKETERCLLILGRAAYGLRKWELSVRHYEDLKRASPSNEDAQNGLLAALSRLAEERTGNYDFAKLFEAACNGETDVDVADYVGPIEVIDIPGKGKGIVATRDVKKGTLLLVSKAFAITAASLPNAALVLAIEEKLARENERMDELAALYYGCERDAAKPIKKSDLRSVAILNRLMQICSYNTFDAALFASPSIDRSLETQQGLWILPSYFNHACLPNAQRLFYGDVMTAFAVVDVKQGEELTLGYTPFRDPYENRHEHLTKGYGFVCVCRLCELDRIDPLRGEREELANEVVGMWRNGREEEIATMTRLVDQIRDTYVGRSELKITLYSPLKMLALAHCARGEHAEAVKYLLEAVECVPESLMSVYGVWVYAPIAVCCDHMRRPRTARRYARMAADMHRIRSGHDDELFKEIHCTVAHLL